MRARLLMVATLAAVLLPPPSVAAPPPEVARAASVEVAHLMFMPATSEVALGASVTWTFPEATQHTTTSDQGFWDSGAKSGGASYARAFSSAGTFAYACTFHPTMRGKVRVAISVLVPSEGRHVVRWATAKAKGAITFDVQLKVGSGPWTNFRTGTQRPKATFRPGDVGDDVYKVRARTARGDQHSGWSRTVTLRFP